MLQPHDVSPEWLCAIEITTWNSRANAGEITPGSICHLKEKPSSNKNVKIVTSDMSKRTLISDI
jgi:hypothetical protein